MAFAEIEQFKHADPNVGHFIKTISAQQRELRRVTYSIKNGVENDESDDRFSAVFTVQIEFSIFPLIEGKPLSAGIGFSGIGVTFDFLGITPQGEMLRIDFDLSDYDAELLAMFKRAFDDDKPLTVGERHLIGIIRQGFHALECLAVIPENAAAPVFH